MNILSGNSVSVLLIILILLLYIFKDSLWQLGGVQTFLEKNILEMEIGSFIFRKLVIVYPYYIPFLIFYSD